MTIVGGDEVGWVVVNAEPGDERRDPSKIHVSTIEMGRGKSIGNSFKLRLRPENFSCCWPRLPAPSYRAGFRALFRYQRILQQRRIRISGLETFRPLPCGYVTQNGSMETWRLSTSVSIVGRTPLGMVNAESNVRVQHVAGCRNLERRRVEGANHDKTEHTNKRKEKTRKLLSRK
jgi:hypothetical protein